MNETVTEAELSQRLGISRPAIAAHRQRSLVRGEDWRKEGKYIVYTKIGSERLVEWAGVNVPPAEEKTLTEPPSNQDEETLTFVQGKYPNRRIIRASRQNGESVFVRVKSSENFRPNDFRGNPMSFPARQESGVWVITRALPRWPGKW